MLAIIVIAYVVLLYAISWYARGKIHSSEDYVVAGRRLGLPLSTATIFATWFGAGTLLSVADEVHDEGLRVAALDPWGAGCCLLLVGLCVAGPMWRMKLLTVADFFRRKYGAAAEWGAALILIPSYFGWIAAQFLALASALDLFFGIDFRIGLALVAVVGTGYTLLGGMWSVTLTDAVQVVLLLVGLVIMLVAVLWQLGSGSLLTGIQEIHLQTSPDRLSLIPTENTKELFAWLGLFAVGALGNIPGQDLMQRVFAAKSAATARAACLLGGMAYLLFGAIPLLLALAAPLLLTEETETSIILALAHAVLAPPVAACFIVALLSAVLSTIDSAILSPATVLSENILGKYWPEHSVRRVRWSVVLVAAGSLLMAYVGEDAFALLENSYGMTLVGLFVPMIIGIYSTPRRPVAGLVSMCCGIGLWLPHFLMGWDNFLPILLSDRIEIPISLVATAASLIGYWLVEPPWVTQWHWGGK